MPAQEMTTQFVVVALLLGLLPSSVVALGTVPSCKTGFNWTFNYLKQSPCTVASALGEVCMGVDFPIPQLNATEDYLGPQPSAANTCRCSSVFYSMLSACALCQGARISTWSFYNHNCSTVMLTVFPQSLPSGFAVPHYAFLNPTANGMDIFNSTIAEADIGPESTATPQATSKVSTTIAAPTRSSPSPQAKESNTGAITGGVIGGIALVIISAIAVWFILRRRRQQDPPPVPYKQLMDYEYPPDTPALANKIYDPNDPSTFPVKFTDPFAPGLYSPPANNQRFPSNTAAGGLITYPPVRRGQGSLSHARTVSFAPSSPSPLRMAIRKASSSSSSSPSSNNAIRTASVSRPGFPPAPVIG